MLHRQICGSRTLIPLRMISVSCGKAYRASPSRSCRSAHLPKLTYNQIGACPLEVVRGTQGCTLDGRGTTTKVRSQRVHHSSRRDRHDVDGIVTILLLTLTGGMPGTWHARDRPYEAGLRPTAEPVAGSQVGYSLPSTLRALSRIIQAQFGYTPAWGEGRTAKVGEVK